MMINGLMIAFINSIHSFIFIYAKAARISGSGLLAFR